METQGEMDEYLEAIARDDRRHALRGSRLPSPPANPRFPGEDHAHDDEADHGHYSEQSKSLHGGSFLLGEFLGSG